MAFDYKKEYKEFYIDDMKAVLNTDTGIETL